MTDHRINLTLYKIDQILAGEALDEVVDALTAQDEADRLAALGEETGGCRRLCLTGHPRAADGVTGAIS